MSTIKEVRQKYDYLIDFHTAVGFAAALKAKSKDFHQVILATASPIKFATEMRQVTGIAVDDRAEITKLRQRPKRITLIGNNYRSFKKILLTSIS